MIDQLNLSDARVGVETYARLIREGIKEQETWYDMVLGAVALCTVIQDTPACRENPYLRDLLINAVVRVLIMSADFFGDSDHMRESALVRSTKRELEEAISAIQDEVDECYPEGQEAFHK